jgi:hypothetical protein
MELSTAQQAELRATYGVCANEVCNACKAVLGHVRFTRADQPGEWCSRVCRDGAVAAERYTATRKQHTENGRCWHCGATLPGDVRTDSKYCDAACKKAAQRAKAA